MNEFQLFEGLGVALVTPFKQDGSLDCTSLSRLVEYQKERGVDFFVLHGSTGESPCIDRDERDFIIDCAYEATRGEIPIVMGLGSNDTRHVVERIRTMDTRKVNGILSVVPYYNKPMQEGIFRHFSLFAEACPLPIILYNIPGRTGMNMLPETTLRLADRHKNIVGIKEASGMREQVQAIAGGLNREDFRILSGDDNLSVPFIEDGARGVISVIGNAYPWIFGRLIHSAMDGDWETAKSINCELAEMNKLLFVNGNPAGIKTLLYQMGLIDHNELRLPLIPATPLLQKQIGAEHKRLSEVFGSRL
ncbi:dihydrodipicolinate synthase [Porphyromonas macacae]|uniref:4-hydroxy-tetrahydrodipicolinate synthase n=1 Tax=Porphyromonas macacae TaxID=28115 RepID=A0A0A2EAA2_9PORP|nr:4-hydroxy-tetrahydrodipicolinate synthase [Porphyromonas macacae]KGN73349.1 dihydrodipicolinate synthase [Porphyromonas macacae]